MIFQIPMQVVFDLRYPHDATKYPDFTAENWQTMGELHARTVYGRTPAKNYFADDGTEFNAFEPSRNYYPVVTKEVGEWTLALGGDIAKSHFFAVVPDIDAALPALMEPRQIPDDPENPDGSTHTETWREREQAANWDLSEQPDGTGYLPLTVADLDGKTVMTLRQANIDCGMDFVEQVPGTEVDPQ